MQEVFEKIIERLEKIGNIQFSNFTRPLITVEDAVKIVNQAVAEYNSWIPVEERLPEEHKLYDITFANSAGIHSDSAIYNPYLKRWLWDADETELVENEVLAWAEKREPYQKGE